jgi:hypothetical protein
MNIKFLEAMSKIRKKSPDKARARSLFDSAESTAREITKLPLTASTATIIFRELYECIRQLGDARWWLLGYSSETHEASMEILKEEKIANSALLPKLDRFRQIRNNANYSGYLVSMAVAQEMLDFWKLCGVEILSKLKSELK